MKNIIIKQINIRNNDITNILVFLNLIILFPFFPSSKNHLVYNYYSEIKLIINEKGYQDILYDSFYAEPSDIMVNGISKKNICSKRCLLEDDYNNITLIFEVPLTTCDFMFNGSNITEIDLSNFDASQVTGMKKMFHFCTKLEKIIFGNINTSSVKNLQHMFEDCHNLKSIDLSKFDTSQVTSLSGMFGRCESIKTIDLSNFQTSKVKIMSDIFAYCYELITVNVSNFDTSNCETYRGIFYDCFKLKYLDLSHFSAKSASNVELMFDHCRSLTYLNLHSFKINITLNPFQYEDLSSYLKLCIYDSYTKATIFNQINSQCSDICFSENIKIDNSTNHCVERCNENQFEYNKLCIDSCFQGQPVIYNDKRICLDDLPENV